ncbi:MAG TPA: DNA/RNA helicase domain-containing protein, partial [Acidimicrobiales bacterium]|nr:DNA/RNA helicase domain-containing protein [Acidimicrobiales bacterium]
MVAHPDLQAEQAYIDHAYACLDATRQRALDLRKLSSIGPGGTHQARYESEIVEDTIRARLQQLHLGEDLALVFGRIDPEASDEHWYIGRIAVADEEQEPVVVDWRAPVAEPFYRATGRQPMGLVRRRHFATRGPKLLDIEDELFGPEGGPDGGLVGSSTLMAALERGRTGRLGDIVATIQTEQDEIIRDELGGVVVVQGGPGTGKTVVALHRAAYLLYTHRFPLEGQGVLVVGPNRLYLRYIERVLPSLGEAGVELAMLNDLIPETIGDARGNQLANRVKGDLRMVPVMAKAVRDRQRGLRKDLEVGLGLLKLRVSAEETQRIVKAARRRARNHNAGRRFVEQGLW